MSRTCLFDRGAMLRTALLLRHLWSNAEAVCCVSTSVLPQVACAVPCHAAGLLQALSYSITDQRRLPRTHAVAVAVPGHTASNAPYPQALPFPRPAQPASLRPSAATHGGAYLQTGSPTQGTRREGGMSSSPHHLARCTQPEGAAHNLHQLPATCSTWGGI